MAYVSFLDSAVNILRQTESSSSKLEAVKEHFAVLLPVPQCPWLLGAGWCDLLGQQSPRAPGLHCQHVNQSLWASVSCCTSHFCLRNICDPFWDFMAVSDICQEMFSWTVMLGKVYLGYYFKFSLKSFLCCEVETPPSGLLQHTDFLPFPALLRCCTKGLHFPEAVNILCPSILLPSFPSISSVSEYFQLESLPGTCSKINFFFLCPPWGLISSVVCTLHFRVL